MRRILEVIVIVSLTISFYGVWNGIHTTVEVQPVVVDMSAAHLIYEAHTADMTPSQ